MSHFLLGIRFWDKVNKNGSLPPHLPELGQCWEWMGARSRTGYGYFKMNGKNVRAHRLAFGPTTQHVLHHCDNPPCVRRSHLFEGTHTDNMRDRVAKGRHYNTLKIHCPKGHEYTTENTWTDGKERQCRACNRDRMRTLYARRKVTA